MREKRDDLTAGGRTTTNQPRRWSERHYELREQPGAPSRHRPGFVRPIDACTFLSFMYIPLDPGIARLNAQGMADRDAVG